MGFSYQSSFLWRKFSKNTIKEYEKHDEDGLPFELVFFILPLILHPETYSNIQNRRDGQFFGWLDKKFLHLIDFENRVKMLKQSTLKSLMFVAYFNDIEIENSRIKTMDFDHSVNSNNYTPYMRHYQDKAIQIGRWFGQSDSLVTIYMMLGVTP